MIDNKAIFHYLNPEGCWHESGKTEAGFPTQVCVKCGFDAHDTLDRRSVIMTLEDHNRRWSDYDTNDGFFRLLEGLAKTGFDVSTGFSSQFAVAHITDWDSDRYHWHKVEGRKAEHIRIALAEAAMQLIPKDGEL